MCTVVFIPNQQSFILASLRDESPERPLSANPQLYTGDGVRYLMPADGLAGGTWIGMNEYRNVIILLNGAFENHKRQLAYRISRGKIVSELLESRMPVVDWQLMDLIEIEPFTLVVWSENNLFELVWDGQSKHRKLMNASEAYIWSSSTLYTQPAKSLRRQAFQNWMLTRPIVSKTSLLSFFKSLPDSENGFIINRNEKIKTLSYSFIEISETDFATFDYCDLVQSRYSNTSIELHADVCLMEQFGNIKTPSKN